MTKVGEAKSIAAQINKALGVEAVIMGNNPSLVVTYIPTGVLPIDVLLGGGIPRGRFTEFYGGPSVLKSYVALKAVQGVQKAGGTAALIDTEHAFDPSWATAIGVSIPELIYMTPATGEEAVDVTEILVRRGIELVVWDSVAATLPQAEQTKRMSKENVQPARLAALMSLASRKITAANKNTAIIFTNQTRINVGQMFGDPETTTGGRALSFYSSYRVVMRPAGKVAIDVEAYDGDNKKTTVKSVIGHKIRAELIKSKLSAPSKAVLFTFDLTTGAVDEDSYMISYALEKGWIKRSGNSWTLGNNPPVVGKDAFKSWIQNTPAIQASLRESCSRGVLALDSRKVVKPKRLLRKTSG